MRYFELVGSPPSEAPQFFQLVTESSHIEEARLLEWNPSTENSLTALYAIDGDATAFSREMGDSSVIVEFELSLITENRFVVLVVGRPSEAPLFQRVIDAVTRMGLIVLTPVVYREGEVRFRIVGEADVLQSMVEAMPSTFDIEVHAIGTFPDATTAPTVVLSERQQDAITAALDLGYYETPRRATHADIADRIGCAPNTATEHLQKAESKLIRAAMQNPGEPVC